MNIIAIEYKNKFLKEDDIPDETIKTCLNQISKRFNLGFKSTVDIILNNIIDFSLIPITFYEYDKGYAILLGYNDRAYEEFDLKIPPLLENSKILHDTIVMFNEELAKKLYFDFNHEFKIEFKGKYKSKLAYYLIDKTTQQKYNIEHYENSFLTKKLSDLEINKKKEDVGTIFNGYYRYKDNNNLTRYTKLSYIK